MNNARDWIEKLKLQAHPEGGWFAETFRSTESTPKPHLPDRYSGDRTFYTSIYFLLEAGQISALHRLQTDEVWHFHDGAPLEIAIIHPDGTLSTQTIGNAPLEGLFPQALVPRDTWFGARSLGDYTLVGCSMAPGFEFEDFEMAKRDKLVKEFPHCEDVITQLTRL